MIFQDYWQILVRFAYLESRKPKAESRKPKAESRKPKAESRDKQTHPLSGI
ncbi:MULTISPECIES: hypothetical protein [Pantoea]|uniref:hypothetical protein n=1 Tax=Pantoea TaxID=53335 RepID=UPI000A6C2E62|nr:MULTISPECIES: hypothetical protein [Pantoea]